MRFRKIRNKKKGIISHFEKIKEAKFIRKTIREIKKHPESIKKRIVVFYDEFNRQIVIAQTKLENCAELNHKENYERIKEYMIDLENIKEKMDNLTMNINDNEKTIESNGTIKQIKKRLEKTYIAKFTLIIREINGFREKYKKEGCDIDNFEV